MANARPQSDRHETDAISIRPPKDLRAWVVDLHERTGRSYNSIVTEALEGLRTDLSGFRVGGYDDESLTYDAPVQVSCRVCDTVQQFVWLDGGGDDYTENLSVLVTWARDHKHATPDTEGGS